MCTDFYIVVAPKADTFRLTLNMNNNKDNIHY